MNILVAVLGTHLLMAFVFIKDKTTEVRLLSLRRVIQYLNRSLLLSVRGVWASRF